MESKPIKGKVFIPEFVTKGYPKPKPMPTTVTLSGYQFVNSNDNLKEIHFSPMIREVYPSWFDAVQDPEVSIPVLMKKIPKEFEKDMYIGNVEVDINDYLKVRDAFLYEERWWVFRRRNEVSRQSLAVVHDDVLKCYDSGGELVYKQIKTVGDLQEMLSNLPSSYPIGYEEMDVYSGEKNFIHPIISFEEEKQRFVLE